MILVLWGPKMAPGNEANTGRDRTKPQEKTALMISFEPLNQAMVEARKSSGSLNSVSK